MITLAKQVKLLPYTPSEQEWSILSFLAQELDIDITAVPDHGYRAAPAINFDGIKGYVQKHISGWQIKQDVQFPDKNVTIQRGVTCQLEKGSFVTNDREYSFTVDRKHTKKFLKPIYELFVIIKDRKISLTQVERELEHHPELKQLIKDTFFNPKFYDTHCIG
jgi:hypothetical protein